MIFKYICTNLTCFSVNSLFCINLKMEIESDTVENVKVEIQETLSSINTITLMIKSELSKLNDLTQENGELQKVIENVNNSLSQKLRGMGIDTENLISELENENDLESSSTNDIISKLIRDQLLEIESNSDS